MAKQEMRETKKHTQTKRERERKIHIDRERKEKREINKAIMFNSLKKGTMFISEI